MRTVSFLGSDIDIKGFETVVLCSSTVHDHKLMLCCQQIPIRTKREFDVLKRIIALDAGSPRLLVKLNEIAHDA
jgi:hypothetical protein